MIDSTFPLSLIISLSFYKYFVCDKKDGYFFKGGN